MKTISTIEHVNPADLLPHPDNSRKHSDEQIARIRASIEEFGFTNPVLIRDNIIYAGHARCEAAKQLHLTDVPVIRLDNLSDIQLKAYLIADNRLAELSDWDTDVLSAQLKSLEEDNFDLYLTGWEDFEFIDPDKILEDEDAAPPPPVEAKTRQGDVYALGDHRLMCGDSTRLDHVELLMNGSKADMVFTDPPYNVDYNPDTRPIGGRAGSVNKLGSIKNDKMDAESFLQFLKDVFASCVSASKPGAGTYICHADSVGLPFRTAFAEVYKLSSVLIWVKNNFVIGCSDYHWKHESILYGWPLGTTHKWHGDRSQTTIWEVSRDSGTDYVHPTQKPVALIEKTINNSSKQRDIVLDLFGGSGSTLAAAEKTNRRSYTMELDPKYCDVIIARWERLTGLTAELLPSE